MATVTKCQIACLRQLMSKFWSSVVVHQGKKHVFSLTNEGYEKMTLAPEYVNGL